MHFSSFLIGWIFYPIRMLKNEGNVNFTLKYLYRNQPIFEENPFSRSAVYYSSISCSKIFYRIGTAQRGFVILVLASSVATPSWRTSPAATSSWATRTSWEASGRTLSRLRTIWSGFWRTPRRTGSTWSVWRCRTSRSWSPDLPAPTAHWTFASTETCHRLLSTPG